MCIKCYEVCMHTCRLIFVNELVEGTVNAYRRNSDNTLTLVQVGPIDIAMYECYVMMIS